MRTFSFPSWLRYAKRVGGTSGVKGPLIIDARGQSNLEGRSTSFIQPLSNIGSVKLAYSNVIEPYSEPGISDVGSIYPTETHFSGQTPFCGFIDQYRALGSTREIIIVDSPKSGTLSSQWKASLIAGTPPWGLSTTQIYGIAQLRLQTALSLYPGAEVAKVIYQGETDAALESDALQHASNWQFILPNWRGFVTSLGGMSQDIDCFNLLLPVTPAVGFDFWSVVNDQKHSLATSDGHMALPQCADGPWVNSGKLHLNSIGQQGTGTALANAIFAVYG